MLKLKQNHTPRDVKLLTDQLVDAVNSGGSGGLTVSPYMTDVLTKTNASEAQTALGISDFAKTLIDDPTSATVLTTLGVSPYIQTLLDDANASSALTTLGVSPFAKTLLDDADASAALSTLGVSAFAKTLLDDGDAPTALSTLGVSAFSKTLLDDADAPSARTTLGALAQSDFTNRKRFKIRNFIINGGFEFWRYNSSQTTSGMNSSDRWYHGHKGSTKSATGQTFPTGTASVVPGPPNWFLRTTVTSVAGASNCVYTKQAIETVNNLSNKTVTITFYAKADAARPIAVELVQFFGTGTGISTPVTGIGATKFNLTTSWQKCQIVVAVPSIVGKTISPSVQDSLELVIWYDAGTTYSTRTAGLGQQSGTFDITRVSVCEGDASEDADPYEYMFYADALAQVGKYYNFYNNMIFSGYAAANGLIYFDHTFVVPMRITPSTFYYSTTYSNASAVAVNGSNTYAHVKHQVKITAAGAGWCQTGIEYYADFDGYVW